uniref:Transcription repressor n=1 Tax=Leersia perrieri TaxID=77586 RepID=A0A0D9V846_9ORYZ
MSGRSSSRRGSFTLRQPPVVDIGCNCRRPKLFSIFSSSSSSSFRRGGGKPKSPNASSTSTTTVFTATTAGAGTATSTDSSWGPASFTTNSLFEEPVALAQQQDSQLETRRRRRQQQRRRRRRAPAASSFAQEEQSAQAPSSYRRVAKESMAVAVESAEPYEDFRESMVQMVVEKEIYAWDDLNDLLHQFLSLNSPRHHPLILHAFADLWTRNGLFSPPSPCQF